MVLVAFHGPHGAVQIGLTPPRVVGRVAQPGVWFRHLEPVGLQVALDHDPQAVLVAQIEERRVGRAVRGAYGVDVVPLHRQHVVAHVVHGDAAATVGMELVPVDTAQDHPAAVDGQDATRAQDSTPSKRTTAGVPATTRAGRRHGGDHRSGSRRGRTGDPGGWGGDVQVHGLAVAVQLPVGGDGQPVPFPVVESGKLQAVRSVEFGGREAEGPETVQVDPRGARGEGGSWGRPAVAGGEVLEVTRGHNAPFDALRKYRERP